MTRRQSPSNNSNNNTRRRTHTGIGASTLSAPASAAKNRRFSLDQAVSSVIYCEGYARIKRRNVLTWNTRFLVLSDTELLVFHNKQDASYRRNVVETLELASGRVASKNDLGIEFTFTDGRELLARMFSRADQAQWVSAFYQLAMRSEVRRVKSASMEDQGDASAVEKRRVSFFGSVLVRTIPTVPDDQVPELFYSKKDVEKFSEQASSLLSRTEDAVSLVFRKPTLPWRRQVVCIVVLALTVATTCSANTVEETGVKARHMLAMGDESIMFARGSLRKEEETD
ncbi:hypothetical protein PI125_g16846 [Phytophthora idaei]|nr:hypothetical protein PI125_g16846 [Phytophthora idaei]KAG3140586.1 hypothetical protein PI126_g15929 [Phytophthora idaei]